MGRPLIDMTGKHFWNLTVIQRVSNEKSGGSKWLCKCDCGKEFTAYGNNIRCGRTKSCGCKQIAKSIVGERFGNLFVIKELDSEKRYTQSLLCKCDCGKEVVVSRKRLLSGEKSNCGCNPRKRSLKFPNLIGQRFGKLTVIGESFMGKSKTVCKCKCDCGAESFHSVSSLLYSPIHIYIIRIFRDNVNYFGTNFCFFIFSLNIIPYNFYLSSADCQFFYEYTIVISKNPR